MNKIAGLAPLPPQDSVETMTVLRACMAASRSLAELKGLLESIPNQTILIDTLVLQEAKDSSAIENIITTHDDLYKAAAIDEFAAGPAAKEVGLYAEALKLGHAVMVQDGILGNRHILAMQATLEGNTAGFRTQAGTVLRNERTGETVYTPPQDPADIQALMANLEQFINDDDLCDLDPLVKMALIHYQFESIHPFYDGNGKTGRIVNMLYLVLKGLLPLPVLYHSRFIIEHKDVYYDLLQSTRTTGEWEPWLVYMLDGIRNTAGRTVDLINAIRDLMLRYKHDIRDRLPRLYSHELLNVLFRYPYATIRGVERALSVTRLTASKYLRLLTENGFVSKHQVGRNNYYVNDALFELLSSRN